MSNIAEKGKILFEWSIKCY